MTTSKKQCQVRLHQKTYDEIREKLKDDELNFQGLADILFSGYLRGDRGVRTLINKHNRKKSDKKNKNQLDPMEKEELLRRIEETVSPLAALERKIEEEIKDEQLLHPID